MFDEIYISKNTQQQQQQKQQQQQQQQQKQQQVQPISYFENGVISKMYKS